MRTKYTKAAKYAGITLLALTALFALVSSPEFNHFQKTLGNTQYYVKVSSGPFSENQSGRGTYAAYTYRLNGYRSDGYATAVEFFAPRVLRIGAYLRVYVRKDGAIATWEEVAPDVVPVDIKKGLDYQG